MVNRVFRRKSLTWRCRSPGIRARAGLRDVARAVYESGLRLDAAGDWLGALQKFEQAGQIHPEVKGLPDAVKRVREKLSAAGEAALVRARRFDEAGRWSDALKEYEKAFRATGGAWRLTAEWPWRGARPIGWIS